MSIECAFLGTLARDAERKVSKSGKSYLRFSCRVDVGDGGQWISVLAFDELAIEAGDKFVKGARIYCEGSIRTEEWTGQDGAKRQGLSCMSWHCRLAEIGRNKPKRPRKSADKPHAAGSRTNNFYSDEIGFRRAGHGTRFPEHQSRRDAGAPHPARALASRWETMRLRMGGTQPDAQ
jgi:single-stranded DNA-binding protein